MYNILMYLQASDLRKEEVHVFGDIDFVLLGRIFHKRIKNFVHMSQQALPDTTINNNTYPD